LVLINWISCYFLINWGGGYFFKKIIRKEKGWRDKDRKEISCTHGLWLRRGASHDLYARSHGHVIKVEVLTKYTVNVSNITVSIGELGSHVYRIGHRHLNVIGTWEFIFPKLKTNWNHVSTSILLIGPSRHHLSSTNLRFFTEVCGELFVQSTHLM
jgi:hypothetical protein